MIHNVEAEQQLLGAILCDNRVYDRVSEVLRPDFFAEPLHGRIYAIAGQRIANGHPVSPVTLKLSLEGDPGLQEMGGPAYLARMAGAAISGAAAPEYAKQIVEAAARRTLNESAVQAQSMLSEGRDSQEIKAALLTALQSLPEASGESSSYSLLRSATDAVMDAMEAYQGNTTFLTTGLDPLDGIIKGLAPGDYMLLAGATSMGKTALAVEIGKNIAQRHGHLVGFVSLEMARDQLANRMISTVSRIPYTRLRDAHNLSEDEMRKWVEAAKAVGEWGMSIIPKHVRDVPAIYAAARRCALASPSGKLSCLIVDYAQLVRGHGKGRYEQMTDVSISIKHLASLLGCPVIALVQLSRDLGQRDDKRPHLFDIKETGQFENDADQVVMCHREEYWLSRQGPKPDKKGDISATAKSDWEADLASVRNRMELLVRKNRHGRIGVAEVGFHDATNRFWKLGQDDGEFA